MQYLFKKDGFDIYFERIDEDMSIESLLGSYSDVDHSDTIRKVKNGTFDLFTARVIAIKEDCELADDYLGGCIYKDTDEFINTKDCYFDDMVNNVIKAAKDKISKLTLE